MTINYHPSSSDKLQPEQDSNTFLLLDEKVQRWVWSQDWEELRDIQEKSIEPILSGNTDVIISSPTASGKTEAAFLPIFSKLINNRVKGIQAIYISPLKALINDQFERLYNLSDQLEIPVHKWHGDISYSYKMKLLQDPQGILQITPESLESLFINHFSQCKKIFNPLLYVIIDELHYFIGSERGMQIQSLLRRLEIMLNRTIPRIGLSATLGDMTLAQKYLRPENGYPTVYISSEGQQETKLQIRGYIIKSDVSDMSVS